MSKALTLAKKQLESLSVSSLISHIEMKQEFHPQLPLVSKRIKCIVIYFQDPFLVIHRDLGSSSRLTLTHLIKNLSKELRRFGEEKRKKIIQL
ncbi:hypothetical protein YC2023_045409 [Brassica napus]